MNKADYANRIGQRLRDLRKLAGKTQRVVSEISGLDQSYISRIEQGEAEGTPAQILRIAESIGASPCDVFSIFSDGESETPNQEERAILLELRKLSAEEKVMLRAMLRGLRLDNEGKREN